MQRSVMLSNLTIQKLGIASAANGETRSQIIRRALEAEFNRLASQSPLLATAFESLDRMA